jgi:putative oxidoreductase
LYQFSNQGTLAKKICCTDDYGLFINLALLLLRVTVGVLMLTHGIPKFVKVLSGDFAFPDPIGIGPTASLLLATFAEFFCSLVVIVGYKSRLAVIPLIITMLVALLIVHQDDAVFEHWNILLYLFSYAILLHLGGGKYSLTYYLQYRRLQQTG